jgi:uncharacterized protein YkwD
VANSHHPRVRYSVTAAAVAAVLGMGLVLAGCGNGSDTTSRAGSTQPLVVDPPAATPTSEATATTGPTIDPTPPAAPTPSKAAPTPSKATPTPSKAAPKAVPPPKPKPKPKPAPHRPTKPKPKPKPGKPLPPASGSVIQQVLAHINQARAKSGLKAYTLSSNLSKASLLHNQVMINGCGLSHRCPGEADLGPRFNAQGVQWSSAGENIGYGSAGSSDSAIIKAANGITDSMLAETPPGDGHRRNLLSSGFKHIGLAVTRDSKGRVWLTQDFVN